MAKFEPDDDLIRRLAALLEETGLSEIEYEAEGQRIRVGSSKRPTAYQKPSFAASTLTRSRPAKLSPP